MKDIENYVYTQVISALNGVDCSSVYAPVPDKYPHLYFTQLNKATHTPYISTSRIDNADEVTFEAQVTSAKDTLAKSECKEIMSAIDDVMYGMRFSLMSSNPVPEVDRTKYRLVHRYSGVVRPYIDGEEDKLSVTPQ